MTLRLIDSSANPARPGLLMSAGNSRSGLKKSALQRVLVVDDEPLICWSIAETLTDCGYDVVKAHDARSAFKMLLAEDSRVDLILLDPSLPDAGDLRALTVLRGFLPSVPVIVMTAHGTPELARRARNEGAFAVIDKPFEMSALPPLVERALAGLAPDRAEKRRVL